MVNYCRFLWLRQKFWHLDPISLWSRFQLKNRNAGTYDYKKSVNGYICNFLEWIFRFKWYIHSMNSYYICLNWTLHECYGDRGKTSRSRPLVFHSSWMLSECQELFVQFFMSLCLINNSYQWIHSTYNTQQNCDWKLRVLSDTEILSQRKKYS